jgi:hypothetical protein
MLGAHKLPSDLLGEVLMRVPNPDTRILALVLKPWHEAMSLKSNPRVWGRLIVAGAKPGVLMTLICDAKV